MPVIEVTASFTVRFKKKVTVETLRRLEYGDLVDDHVDETEAYEALRTDGDCSMEWEEVTRPKKARKKKAKRG